MTLAVGAVVFGVLVGEPAERVAVVVRFVELVLFGVAISVFLFV